jgi:predicted amidohydrolase
MVSVRVGALQFDVRRDAGANLERVEAGLREARERGLSLVVLPEMWPTSFPDAAVDVAGALEATDRALARIAELSRELELAVAGSALARGATGEEPCNRLHVFDRGDLALEYDKAHLFSPTAEDEGFSAGCDAPPTIEMRLGRLSGAVCYDLRFPDLWHRAHAERVELFVVPAQWPSARAAQFRALVHGVAAANQCFVVACNRTGRDAIGRRRLELEFPGNSIVAAPSGATLAEGRGADGLVFAEIDLDEARELKRRVPVAKDRRDDLYRRWRGA